MYNVLNLIFFFSHFFRVNKFAEKKNWPSAIAISHMQILILTCILKGKSLIINFQNIYLNNFAYSFHNKLKTTYLNGKVNRRVDFVEERPPLLAAQSAQEGNQYPDEERKYTEQRKRTIEHLHLALN